MKKLIALLLAVLLLAGMGTTTYAASPVETPVPTTGGIDMGGTGGTIGEIAPVSLPINGSFQPFASGQTYQVRLEWSGLSFTYHPKSNGKWNPEDLNYSGGTPTAYWTSGDSGSSGMIKLLNHSDASINYTIAANMETTWGTIRMRFSQSDDMSSPSTNTVSGQLLDAVGGTPEEAQWYLLPYCGTISNFGENTKIGTITVTVSAAE